MTAAARGIRVRGTVQGVGFRPTVYRLAHALGLSGLVRNDSAGVWIEIEGETGALEDFIARLRVDVPPLGRIDGIETVAMAPTGAAGFRVEASAAFAHGARPGTEAIVPADAATCAACLVELFDARDRRYRYPFINCTDCGPRYTIVRDVPYDRARTTMASFTLCAACQGEYEDPGNRRFHAEPNACPACGPTLAFSYDGDDKDGACGAAALAGAVAALAAGAIVAVKGLGGFHLAADARNGEAIARLRKRKRRPAKPFAIMARDAGAIDFAVVSDVARAALESSARPIVLLPSCAAVEAGLAPGLGEIGVMLPYTPLHHLLLADGPALLVMTSGNRAEEPIARTNGEARARLAGIADAFLVHDRDIHTRADDSVVRVIAGGTQPVRRSRGFVPQPIAIGLGVRAPAICAVGAELKNTVCMTRDDQAVLSPHIGDLENTAAYGFFEELIDKLGRLLDVTPAIVAHDLHPDYLSTRWALDSGREREAVQHHHAHIASCLVENGHFAPAIGIAFDGTGCGPAGDLWGGEILQVDLVGARRLGHLRAIALPGAAAAIREPWRLAVAALLDAGLPLAHMRRIPAGRLAGVASLVARAPRATGAGRWFDAVAALCGVRDAISYEGQAAVELEALAAPGEAPPYPYGDGGDLRPTIRAIVQDIGDDCARAGAAPVVSARFHATLAHIVRDASRSARAALAIDTVALSGGCFQNRLLTETCKKLLDADGFEVLIHRRVPPSDGGVALGQAAVAAHRWHRRQEQDRSSHVPRHSR
jgi:hydrogenase maturation protein HypF